MKETVDEDVLFLIGEKYQKTLISLELRACNQVNDKAIVGLCERLSGVHQLRNGVEPLNEDDRYKFIYSLSRDWQSQSNLEFLNLADLK